jgi:two-component sensor histidine kinase
MAEGRRLTALRKDGSRISVDIALNPVLIDGRPKAVAVWITDSSARERAEVAELFVKELTHRARNMFSIISAISRQIAKSSADIAEFQPAFERRLNSLSASYQVFEKENWQAAPIGELVRSQVEFVLKDGTHQIDIDGCDIRLPASPAEYLGLAIHELATNALKHGALSVPEGRVYVRWSMNKEDRVFQFSWIERNGPAFPPPERRGFGSVILNSIVPAACGGTAELKVTGAGMAWQLEAPLSILSQPHQTAGISEPKGTANDRP